MLVFIESCFLALLVLLLKYLNGGKKNQSQSCSVSLKGSRNSFSSKVNTRVKIRRNYTITGSFQCLDIQYFGNGIYVFPKGTALMHLTHPSLKAMRFNIA